MRIEDAADAIPSVVQLASGSYLQQPRLSDGRPVYLRDSRSGNWGTTTSAKAPNAVSGTSAEGATSDVYLFYRAHEGEWWLGPIVGGTLCFARASASPLMVVPRAGDLVWRSGAAVLGAASGRADNSRRGEEAPASPPLQSRYVGSTGDNFAFISSQNALGNWVHHYYHGQRVLESRRAFFGIAFVCIGTCLAVFALGQPKGILPLHPRSSPLSSIALSSPSPPPIATSPTSNASGTSGGSCRKFNSNSKSSSDKIAERPTERKTTQARSRSRRVNGLLCVVCLEAPREILLSPCRHACCCQACASQLELCPMCRTRATEFTKIFL